MAGIAAEVSLIDLVQREADAERCSYSQIINRALRQYFVGKVTSKGNDPKRRGK
jgi:hypothetical protein